MLTKQKIEKLFATFESISPSPTTELEYKDAFTLLIAVVLSAQMTDVGVNKATRLLFADADSPEKILALGEGKLKDYLKTINFYNNKARNVISLCKELIEKHNGKVPDNIDDLTSLSGVGVKTASVVLNTFFGQDKIAVDTHVFRTSKRIGLSFASTPEKMQDELEKIIPKKYRKNAHHWLILHGRYTCKAQKPLCGVCPVSQFCDFLKGAQG